MLLFWAENKLETKTMFMKCLYLAHNGFDKKTL